MSLEISRRGFLAGILAAAVAPAIVRASSLMVLPTQRIMVPDLVIPDLTIKRYIRYDFGHDKEFSFSAYTGDGGQERILLDWKPQFVMLKRIDAPGEWVVTHDGKPASMEEAAKILCDRHGFPIDGLNVFKIGDGK